MAKAQSPLLGFNNNVRHHGRVFHIQTEDSGIKYPHVITHLFADGGRILKSIRTSYSEYLGSENLEDTVRSLMKEQHKAMFIALRDGQFDGLVTEESAAEVDASAPAARAASTSELQIDANERADAVGAGAGADAQTVPATAAASDAAVQVPRVGEVDVETLERAAAAAQSRSNLFHGTEDMPPPPAAVLASNRPSGSYRALTSSGSVTAREREGKDTTGRYSATRPASIFGTTASSDSLFGEDVISGKSLDEVILSFLSEEFGAASDKDGGGRK